MIMYGIVLPRPDFPGGVPIVKGGDVSPERLNLERLNRIDLEIEARYARSRLAGGDIVYAIRGSIGAAAAWRSRATIRRINIFSLKRAVLPVPPYPDQVAIREHLDAQTRTLDKLHDYVSEAVGRLREYRSALITAAMDIEDDAVLPSRHAEALVAFETLGVRRPLIGHQHDDLARDLPVLLGRQRVEKAHRRLRQAKRQHGLRRKLRTASVNSQ